MNNILSNLNEYKSVIIAGHVRPDGDCAGACLALYNYIINKYPSIRVDVYLEPISDALKIIKNSEIINNESRDIQYDLFIALDCGDIDRLGSSLEYFKSAKKTINIDHHISNTRYADINYIIPEASSTCEILFDVIGNENIDKDIAEALYIGIIYDTGVFKHSNTSEKTLAITGKLINKGINFSKIIDNTMNQRTFIQNKLLGRALLDSKLLLNGKVIYSVLYKQTVEELGGNITEIDGIIDQLRITKGVECAIFIYDTDIDNYKVSLRSNGTVDVCAIARQFGGGGHIKASGCSIEGNINDIINNLTTLISQQL